MSELSSPIIREYSESLADFIKNSPTPYHASLNIANSLEKCGFERLEETADWNLVSGGKYYVVRNDTSLIAFRNGRISPRSNGIRAIGAHLDSPCLKLNLNPVVHSHGYQKLNVEVYGSALQRTWFDRDLSIAGRIFYRNASGNIGKALVDVQKPVAVIPSIAIHLDRDANTRQKINSQNHLNPIFASGGTYDNSTFVKIVCEQLEDYDKNIDISSVLSYDLSFYDTNGPEFSGISGEFISSARIDNLLSCHAGMHAIVSADTDNFCVLVCSDHEEVGSVSDSGAQGTFLPTVIERTVGLDAQVIRRSMLISADGAHGIHPNYPEKHDEQHAPVLNQGLVIKVNSNQRYATTGESVAFIKILCEHLDIPVQIFTSKNNMPCGSTIGPIVASEIGIKTVDAGVAQFAMHSIRELAGTIDGFNFTRMLGAFLESELAEI